MADAFLGELRLLTFDEPPEGWTRCDGQLLNVDEHPQLFQLIGRRYGGDGVTTFALPDLRGRLPTNAGLGLVVGQKLGEETHNLTMAEMTAHSHQLLASSVNANDSVAIPRVLAAANNLYHPAASLTTLHPSTVTTVGSAQAHENRHPYLALSWCIALTGAYPTGA